MKTTRKRPEDVTAKEDWLVKVLEDKKALQRYYSGENTEEALKELKRRKIEIIEPI